MSEARDNPDVPQGVTVYTRAAEKEFCVLKYIGNISGLAALARHSLGSSHLERFLALVELL